MKELNEKLILLISTILLVIGLGFIFLFPSKKGVEAKSVTTIKKYTPINVREGLATNSDWPEAKEQAKGEMFDLFTPPEIYINESGNFVFRPPYAVTPKGPFGVNLIEINLDPYRFQLEGFVEEDRSDQSRTTILVHSVEDGKSLRLKAGQEVPEYDIKILDWNVDRNFDNDNNTQVVARLKLLDKQTSRIINLRHDENLYEESVEIVLQATKTGEIYMLRGTKNSFFIEDVEFRLDDIDKENLTVTISKLISDADPITETLKIQKILDLSSDGESNSNKPASIEEAFNSIF